MGEHSKINPGPFIEFLNNVCPAVLGAPKARGHGGSGGSGGSGAGAERRCVFAWHDVGLQDEISKHFASLEMMNKVRHFIYDDQDTTFFIARELVRLLASSSVCVLFPHASLWQPCHV